MCRISVYQLHPFNSESFSSDISSGNSEAQTQTNILVSQRTVYNLPIEKQTNREKKLSLK